MNCGLRQNRPFHDLFTWLKLYPKHLFRNCLHLRLTIWTQSPMIIISCVDMRNQKIFPDLLKSSLLLHTRIPHARVSPAPTSKSSLTSTLIPRSMCAMASSFAFLVPYSPWPCLVCAVSRSVLMNQLLLDRLVLLRFTRSLVHSVARVRIFLQSQRRIQLCGPCLANYGRLAAFTASFTVPRVSIRLLWCPR